MRPANIITAWADILSGFGITGLVFIGLSGSFTFYNYFDLFWLILSTTGLYGGGVVFNDVFDYKLDKIERPERALPSGRASMSGGIALGVALILVGILAAFQVSSFSGKLAIIIAVAALHYDKIGKHNAFIGPLNMGFCRGLNLMLGMSVAAEAVYYNWFICLIPIIFISAITMISRSEVSGGDKKTIAFGAGLFSIVAVFIALLGLFSDNFDVIYALPFLVFFIVMVFKPLIAAFKSPTPANIKLSVRGGILGLIPMDAAIAAGFAGWIYGLGILLLLPLSIFLAKKFAVT